MDAMLHGPSGQVTLGTAVLTIGRAPDNVIVLNDVKASGHHAEIRPTAQGYVVVDLGSTNGTFLNGAQLMPQVPRELKSFDVIGIGDTSYTYQVSGTASVEPTVYAKPPQGNIPAYPPTVAAQPPTFYGGGSPPPPPQQEFQVYESAPVPLPYAPVPGQPAYPPAGVANYGQQQPGTPGAYPGYMPPPQGVPAYPGVPAQPGRQNRRNLYIGGAVAVALVVGIILYVVLSAASPSKTMSAFCNGLVNHDYQAAYDTLSANQKSKGTEATFAEEISASGLNGCSYSNVTQSGSTATADTVLSYAGGRTKTFKATLVNESGGWKINDLQDENTQ